MPKYPVATLGLLIFSACLPPAKRPSPTGTPPSVWDESEPRRASSSSALSDVAKLKDHVKQAQRSSDSVSVFLTTARLKEIEPKSARWSELHTAAETELGRAAETSVFQSVLRAREDEARRDLLDSSPARDTSLSRSLQAQKERLQKTRQAQVAEIETDIVRLTLMDEEQQLIEAQTADETAEARGKDVMKKKASLQRSVQKKEQRLGKLDAQIEEIDNRLGVADSELSAKQARHAEAKERVARVDFDSDLLRWWKNFRSAPPAQEIRESKPETSGSRPARTDRGHAVERARVAAAPVPSEPPLSSEQEEEIVVSKMRRPVLIVPPDAVQPEDPPLMSAPRGSAYRSDQKPFHPQTSKPNAPAKPRGGPGDQSLRPTVGNLYQVRQGDTLPSLAAEVYGDAERWKEIYQANRHTVFRGMLQPGQWLILP